MSQSHKSYPKKHGGAPQTHHSAAESGRPANTSNKRAFWFGFLVCAVGYLILSFQQPAGWGQGLWAFLAFLLFPGLAGVVIHFSQGSRGVLKEMFMRGLKSAGCAMFLYTGVTLIVLASRVGRPDGGGQIALAWFLTTGVFTLLAGSVAGCVNMLLSKLTAQRDNHGSTS